MTQKKLKAVTKQAKNKASKIISLKKDLISKAGREVHTAEDQKKFYNLISLLST